MDRGDRLVALMSSVYRSVVQPERWWEVLCGLQHLLNASACDISVYDFATQRGEVVLYAGSYQDNLIEAYNAGCAPLNPWMRRQEFYSRADLTWPGTAIVPESALLQDAFYHHWLQPQDLYYRVATVICREGTAVVYIAALTSQRAGDFDGERLFPLQRIAPHIRQALDLRRRLTGDVASSVCPLAETVHRLGEAARVGAAARAAALRGADGTAADCSVPSLSPTEAVTEARQLAHAAPQPGVPPSLLVAIGDGVDASGGQPLQGQRVVRLIGRARTPGAVPSAGEQRQKPIEPGSPRRVDGDHGVTPVNGATESPNEEKLRRLYGLTQAEARVACLLASGLTSQRVARQLDIGITTIRTHLQRIFGKTGAHHQAQLVALLLAGPARLEISFLGSEGDEDEAECFG